LRLRILTVLEEGAASPKEMSDRLEAPLGSVAYHVRQLERFGLIECVRRTQRRGAIEHHYRMIARPSITDEAWRAAPEIAKQALVGSVLGQISSHVNSAAAEGGFSGDGAHLTRVPLALDERGWRAASVAAEQFVERLHKIQRQAAERVGRKPEHAHADRRSTAVVMLFEAATEESRHDHGTEVPLSDQDSATNIRGHDSPGGAGRHHRTLGGHAKSRDRA
jgi:predicted transcriptional regulator